MMNFKTIEVNLLNKKAFDKQATEKATKDDLVKTIQIEIPTHVIGVGIISAIDDYLVENKLDDWLVSSYRKI